MQGAKVQKLNECPAGNVCGLMGIDRYLTKSGTLCDSEQIFPFKTMKFSVSPIVNVAVSVVDAKNLKKLVEGLQRLSKYDNIVQITQNKQGQQIVAGSGELHLQTCLSTLKREFMNGVEITTSTPIVSFCEGIDGKTDSPKIITSKSPNKLNRIYMNAEPLDDKICSAIECDQIILRSDMKSFGRDFAAKFPKWDKSEAAKIWTFGCAPYGRANILCDATKGVDYLDKVKASVCAGFVRITSGGVLCDEPLRGVRFNLIDAKIHSEPAHHGTGQIVPCVSRACNASLLASTPILFEPMYIVDIEVPMDAQNGVFNTFGQVRGEFVSMTDKMDIGIPLCRISGFVPIAETLKNDEMGKIGFSELLRTNTKGKAFPTMKFSHWQKIGGDPLINGSMSNKLVMDIRKRKGMKAEIPILSDYYDKI